jgi:hypothetical protein
MAKWQNGKNVKSAFKIRLSFSASRITRFASRFTHHLTTSPPHHLTTSPLPHLATLFVFLKIVIFA